MKIPIEILVHILQYCDRLSFVHFGQTCSRYLELLNDNSIWNQMTRNDFKCITNQILFGSLSYRAMFNLTKVQNDTIPRNYQNLYRNKTPLMIFKKQLKRSTQPLKRKTTFFLIDQ